MREIPTAVWLCVQKVQSTYACIGIFARYTISADDVRTMAARSATLTRTLAALAALHAAEALCHAPVALRPVAVRPYAPPRALLAPVRPAIGAVRMAEAAASSGGAAPVSGWARAGETFSNLFPLWTLAVAILGLYAPGVFSGISTKSFTGLLGTCALIL